MERLETREESIKIEFEMRDIILSKGEVKFLHTGQISSSIVPKGIKAFFCDMETSIEADGKEL